jgi:hypothetical protein
VGGADGDEAILPMRMFRSSVFSVTNVVSLLVGAGMFGGLVVVPLYLQIVKGLSPTEAGLQLIPLMVGIILTSGISGKVMSRTGRYKRLPIVGTALMIVAMLLFSTLDADSPIWRAMAFMVVMGAGPRPVDADARHQRAERHAAAGHGRRHQLGDVLPLDGRHLRRGRLARGSCSRSRRHIAEPRREQACRRRRRRSTWTTVDTLRDPQRRGGGAAGVEGFADSMSPSSRVACCWSRLRA